MKTPRSIARWRKRIDEIDRKLVRLLNRRAECSLAVGRIKDAAGLRLFHRQREREISQNVIRANRGPLTGRALDRLFTELLRLTRVTVRAALRKEHTRRRQAAK
jgi:chorismate mutase/prephenate dehydratase